MDPDLPVEDDNEDVPLPPATPEELQAWAEELNRAKQAFGES